jgi:hypothetical protein
LRSRSVWRLCALLTAAVLSGSVLAAAGPAPAAQASCLECPPWHTHPRHLYPKDNPLTSYEKSLLTTTQRHAVIAKVHHSSGYKTLPSPLAPTATATGTIWCRETWFRIWSTNALGWTIWNWKNTVHWCWSNGKVVSIDPPVTTVQVHDWAAADGWEYKGIQDSAQWDYYHDRWVYSTYRQGHFSFCPPRIFCVQSKYPWVYIYTYGSGHYGNGGYGW